MAQKISSIKELAGKNITVMGAGRTGIAVSRLLARSNINVLLSDQKKKIVLPSDFPASITKEFGGHSQKILNSSLIIKSPGIPLTAPILKKAQHLHIPIWDELNLFSLLVPAKKIIAITGTNGKTTTTALVAAILKHAGYKTVTAGNIGVPLSSVISESKKAGVIVIELSSYQLEIQDTFAPHIAVVLNLSPDHMARHKTMARYRRAKQNICINQKKSDFCILNYEDMHCRNIADVCAGKVSFFSSRRNLRQGIYYNAYGWHVRQEKQTFTIAPQWHLPGMHNIENGLAAIGCAALFGVSPKKIESGMASFKGIRHRLEHIARINGVSYVNDSKATNVDSTMVALKSFDGPLWLIIGGEDKGSSYRPLLKYIQHQVKGIILIGEASSAIDKDLKGSARTIRCHDLKRAVAYCSTHVQPDAKVLFSPACASFDQYANFEERGDHFRELVLALKK